MTGTPAPAPPSPPTPTSGTRQMQHGAAVWRAADVAADRASWEIRLGDDARAAIVEAAHAAVAAGVPMASLAREQFPLPGLEDDLARWPSILQRGCGFVLLRGFPVDRLSPPAVELAWYGLGLHLGRPVAQTAAGELLTHIRDERLPADAGKVRLYRTRQRQDFHTDGADIIGLLCLHGALRGGRSRIVSSWALYNELLATRPDLLEALYESVGWDRQGDVPAGQAPWFSLAPITDVDGAPRLFYIGWYIRESQQHPDAPRLTPRHLEAMDLLERLANDPAFHLEMDFEPGDIQLLNNGRILHAREAYDDHPDPARRRHLLRLWLAAHNFASLEAGLRGGIAPPTPSPPAAPDQPLPPNDPRQDHP